MTRPLIIQRSKTENALHPFMLTIYERQPPKDGAAWCKTKPTKLRSTPTEVEEDSFKISGIPPAVLTWLQSRRADNLSDDKTMVRYNFGGPLGRSYTWMRLVEFEEFLTTL